MEKKNESSCFLQGKGYKILAKVRNSANDVIVLKGYAFLLA